MFDALPRQRIFMRLLSLHAICRLACLVLFTGLTVQACIGDDGAASSEPTPERTNENISFVWDFDGSSVEEKLAGRATAAAPLRLEQRGVPQLAVEGPRPVDYPDFDPQNLAVKLPRGGNYFAVESPASTDLRSAITFDNGDEITLEAWLRWDEPLNGSYPYIIGKGRTHRDGANKFNHNYALRLATGGGGVGISFLFADAETAQARGGSGDEWHRWTSSTHVPEDGQWHHVAVTYLFGEPESMRGYIDGVPTEGQWDAGGPTTNAPVVDDDELWIGSSMGGSSTFNGYLDSVALHRRALSAEEIADKVKIDVQLTGSAIGIVDSDSVPADRVRVELMEGVPVARSWNFRVKDPEVVYETDLFALKEIPRKYNAKGLIVDRKVPQLLHLCSQIELPAGEYEFILRSLDSARLYIDGDKLTETRFQGLSGSAHNAYYHLPDPGEEVLSLAAAHDERRVTVNLSAGKHAVSLYRLLGNKGKGDYVGEICLAYGPVGGPYRFVSPSRDVPFTDASWLDFLPRDEQRLRDWELRVRQQLGETEQQYWSRRHDFARAYVEQAGLYGEARAADSIDAMVERRLNEAGVQPVPLVNDYAFLRRVTLDVVGVIPTPEEIEQFLNDPPETRRELAIDRLLADPRWADHWVGYWQDVLAENPGLTKPELNNSGPFRWFIYESFVDNKPIDRFVTELLMMEGSQSAGGPAGFAIASQNDVPMAAKAHVVGTAFLGVEMKCARCHDAPYHDVLQQDLFSVAAMLNRGPQAVPKSSSIPATPEQIERMIVKVTLPPGSAVKPDWPFVEFVSVEQQEQWPELVAGLPPELIRNAQDTRELLAAQITGPTNTRFARVIANRMWQRYMGRGLVDPVDDWEGVQPSNPALLDWLARELVTHDYDLKHVARLILGSRTYQRTLVGDVAGDVDRNLFAGPVRRRLTGEQMVDSLFGAVGKDFAAEELTMDRDGTQSSRDFVHLRFPRRAWELVTVSNERDRPSLNLPVAQSLVDLLAAYGWRPQRQDPLTTRETTMTPLQPMVLAHGAAASRVVDFADGSALTTIALRDQPVDRFVDDLFLRLLSRPATSAERTLFVELLSPGYGARVVAGPESVPPRRIRRSGVTWSNHFAPESDVELMNREREVLQGDPPTQRLDADWRERAEDAVWTLVNSPEFAFVP
ncbi:MAG: DUF1553 domain-containing protein [Planctomycetaceae bacterium]